MILGQDSETGWWTRGVGPDARFVLHYIHEVSECGGTGTGARLCDVHDKRGESPWSEWPLNWRDDRGIMEMIDPKTGIGHPTPAQVEYWAYARGFEQAGHEAIHGCDGGCAGAYDQVRWIGDGRRDSLED